MSMSQRQHIELSKEYKQYMLLSERIDSTTTLQNDEPEIENTTTSVAQPAPISSIIKINQVDTLFWSYYILKYGYGQYINLGNKHYSVEQKEKFKCVDEMHKSTLIQTMAKSHKLNMTEIAEDLTSRQRISLKTFFALCMLSTLNCIVVCGRKYYEWYYWEHTEPNNHIVVQNADKSFSVFDHPLDTEFTKIRSTLFGLQFYEDGIKAITNYKVAELSEIATRLNIQFTEIKPLKKTIYEAIVQALS